MTGVGARYKTSKMPPYKRVRVPLCVENVFYATMLTSCEPECPMPYSMLLGLCAETIGPRMAEPAILAVAEAVVAASRTLPVSQVYAPTFTRFFEDDRFAAFRCERRSKALAFVVFMAFVAATTHWPWSSPHKQARDRSIFERGLRELSAPMADALLALNAA